ncbi:MAG: BamA/TamA family outer membrane protein [Chitinophagaceae bacterium]
MICLSQCLFAQINSDRNIGSFIFPINPGDPVSKLHLRKISISGNKKTKDYIILREMQVKAGDSILLVNLNTELEKARQHIYNTTLFVEVAVEPIIISAFDFDIKIIVKERWYIFPLPELQIVDGTLNEWLIKYKGDLDRLNYGIKFTHFNLTGRKDQLRIHLLNGYTRTISINYSNPYSNATLTNGFSVGAGYFQNRETAYKTSYDNEIVFYKRNDFVRYACEIQLGYSVRRGLKLAHSFGINYSHVNIDDSIISTNYNRAYFNKPTSKIGYVDLYYALRYTDVNNVLYPLTGFSYSTAIGKRGLGFSGGINQLSLDGEYNKYWSLGKKWYVSAQIQGNIKLPFKQAYINQQALGYGNNYIRGMEFKIIDGVAYAISKFNLKREIFKFSVNTIFKKSKTLNKIPFRIYAKTFADMAYSYNEEEFVSRLNNTFLGSAGIGLDIVTFYDLQIRIEYSLNQLGQKRLFLHNDKGF